MSSTTYTEENIQTLSDVQVIRLRPAMYTGCTGVRGIHVLLREVLDNSLQELREGFGSHIGIALFADGSCAVSDDGRGISVEIDRRVNRTAVIAALTVFGYSPTGGIHSIGLKAANALCERGEIHTLHDGQHYRVEFERGLITSCLTHIGPADGRTGTTVRFKPDPESFGDHTFDLRAILHTLCELAFLHAGVRFTFTDERTGKTDTFHFPDGLAAFVKYLNTGEEVLHNPIHIRGEQGGIGVDAALQIHTGCETVERGYVNAEFTSHGGTHLRGFRRGWGTTLRAFAKRTGLPPVDRDRVGTSWQEGMTVVLSITHPNPQWERATKSALLSVDAEVAVASVVHRELTDHLTKHPQVGRLLWERAMRSAKERAERTRIRTHRRQQQGS